jgi:hypothetical protein
MCAECGGRTIVILAIPSMFRLEGEDNDRTICKCRDCGAVAARASSMPPKTMQLRGSP